VAYYCNRWLTDIFVESSIKISGRANYFRESIFTQ
jgi:hypothetical protein